METTKLPEDHHVHTRRCGHAEGELEEYVAAGEKLAAVGFCDHLPFPDPAMHDPVLAMSWDDFPGYLADVLRLKSANERVVLLGVEADYIPGYERALAKALGGAPLDYVFGSVHVVDDWPFDDGRSLGRYGRGDVTALYLGYYRLVVQMAATALFDVWAHPDLPKKFGYHPAAPVTDAENDALAAVAAARMAIEINTSGLRKPAGEIYPSPAILRRARAAGVPITFGSDAHRPSDVGFEFPRAVSLARDAGYEEYVTFKGREKVVRPLPSPERTDDDGKRYETGR